MFWGFEIPDVVMFLIFQALQASFAAQAQDQARKFLPGKTCS
jgi:hypothetical protein